MGLVDSRRAVLLALVAVLMLALPGIALAQDDKGTGTEEVTAEEGVTEETKEEEDTQEPPEVLSTLPVLGAGLNITVGRDAEGGIASIALDPDTATVVKEGDHRVVFLLEDGDTKVVVKSGKGYIQTTVRADDPADVTGDGAWSADVFGNGTITVPYNVSFDGITPSITVGSITTPADVTAEIGEPKTKTSDDADKAFSKVKIRLGYGDETAVLSLKAKVYVTDQGATKVKVSATLSSRDRVKCRDGRWDEDDRRDRGDWDRKRGDWDEDRDHEHDRDDRRGERDGRRWDRDDDSDGEGGGNGGG